MQPWGMTNGPLEPSMHSHLVSLMSELLAASFGTTSALPLHSLTVTVLSVL